MTLLYQAGAVARYEMRMQLRRPTVWLTTVVVFGFITQRLLDNTRKGGPRMAAPGWGNVLREAAQHSMLVNILFPVGAGLLLADRLARDRMLGTGEVLDAAGLAPAACVWGKLAGAGGALALLCLGYTLAVSGWSAVGPDGPAALVAGLLAFLAIGLPAVLFVAAFSIAGGYLLGRVVYLVGFIGYWFWGNLVDPHAVPSLSCTLLSPVGGNASAGWLGGTALYAGTCSRPPVDPGPGDALTSVLLILIAAVGALLASQRLLARRRITP